MKKDKRTVDIDKIADSIKSFASEYNDVIDKACKTSSKEVSQNTKYMTALTNVMSIQYKYFLCNFTDEKYNT